MSDQHGYQPTSDQPDEPPDAPDFEAARTAAEPTQLDRIEAKIDQILAAQHLCPACAERKREEDAATEQWKQEFMARHGLTSKEEPPKFATGGFVKGPPTPITIDLSREQIITAEDIRNSPQAQAALEKLRQQTTANANNFESTAPGDKLAREFEAELRRAVKRSD